MPCPRTMFGVDDYVDDLTTTAKGYVAVGGQTRPGQPSLAVVWTSADGLTWTRRTQTQLGLPSSADGLNLSSVAVSGAVVVVVGSASDDSQDYREKAFVMRSGDAGVSWSVVPVPDPQNGVDFVSSLTSVTALASGGFAAFGSAYYAPQYQVTTYLGGADGAGWTETPATLAFVTADNSFATASAAAPWGIATFAYTEAGTTVVLPKTITGFVDWVDPTVPAPPKATTDAAVVSATTSGSAVIAVVQYAVAGRVVSQIWRTVDGKSYAAVTVPALSPASLPVIAPYGLVESGSGLVAVGTSQGLPVLWRSRPDGTFGAPEPLPGNDGDHVAGLVRGPKGLLAYGTRLVRTNRDAKVWASTDGTTFTQSDNGEFGLLSPFAFSLIYDAAWVQDRWVVVGARTDNEGRNLSALVASSKDGVSWVDGSPAHPGQAAAGAQYPLDDLSGNDDARRQIFSVAATAQGVVAAGRIDTDAAGSLPGVWRSPDAKTWSLAPLPLPGGAVSGSSTSVVGAGTRVVIAGSTTTADGTDRAAYWLSNDGGATFTVAPLPVGTPGDATQVADLDLVGTTFVITGATGPEGSTQTFFLTSTDGRTWTPLTPADPLLLGSGERRPGAAVGVDGALVGIGYVHTKLSSGPILFTQPVP